MGFFDFLFGKPKNKKRRISTSTILTPSPTPRQTSMVRVDIDSFIDIYRSSIPEDTFIGMLQKQLDGHKGYLIPRGVYEQILEEHEANEKKNEALENCAALNNEGIAYEKSGDIDAAIRVYEENIALGYPALHAFKRLMVLYRKQKDYENEIRVILHATEVLGGDWSDRLEKAQKLLEKQKSKS